MDCVQSKNKDISDLQTCFTFHLFSFGLANWNIEAGNLTSVIYPHVFFFRTFFSVLRGAPVVREPLLLKRCSASGVLLLHLPKPSGSKLAAPWFGLK